jgi:hypothetical protein
MLLVLVLLANRGWLYDQDTAQRTGSSATTARNGSDVRVRVLWKCSLAG